MIYLINKIRNLLKRLKYFLRQQYKLLHIIKIYGRRLLHARPRFQLEHGYDLKEYEALNKHVFFGYHDISPFNKASDKLLACRVDIKCILPETYPLEVGYYNLINGQFISIDFTSSWCWQQSCRLQWWPTKDNWVLFNKAIDGVHKAVVFDITKNKTVRTYERAIYSISEDANYAISLNFPRLQRLRPGYGYADIRDNTLGQLAPENAGLWLIDLKTGNNKLLISLNAIANWNSTNDMNGAEHYFNHVMWAPNSKYFLVYHFWVTVTGARKSRVLIWEIETRTLSTLPTEGHASHFAWLNQEELLIYTKLRATGTNFHKFNIKSSYISTVGDGVIDQDAHLMINPIRRNQIIMDYYPDIIHSERTLFTFDLNSQKIKSLGRFYSPLNLTGERRCDLHSRWDSKGKKICIDSAHSGKRSLYVINKINTK